MGLYIRKFQLLTPGLLEDEMPDLKPCIRAAADGVAANLDDVLFPRRECGPRENRSYRHVLYGYGPYGGGPEVDPQRV